MKSSASFIWSSLSIVRSKVSVELTRDLSWFGKDGISIIWIWASSCMNVPS